MTSARPLLILVLPDLGGIGKSTLSEQLVAMLEIAYRPVVAIDGDPTSRGLMARRAGRRTVPVDWSAGPASRAAGIRSLAKDNNIGVLDFGGGSSLTPSVDLTIAELCDGSTMYGVETVVIMLGESSKPGLATAVTRFRMNFPRVRTLFCRNAKSGADWSSYIECTRGLPMFDLPAMPVAVTSWLSNHGVVRNDATGGVTRPALADLVLSPKPGYDRVGCIIAGLLNAVSQQPAMIDLLSVSRIPRGCRLNRSLVLSPGPMTDEYLAAHNLAAHWLQSIVTSVPPPDEKREQWIKEMGSAALRYARQMAKLRAIRESGSPTPGLA